MPDFTVDRRQLDAGADRFSSLTTTVAQIHAALEGMNASRGDFGYVPWIGSRTHDAYVEHRESCLHSTDEMRKAVKSAGDALSATSTVYRAQDEAGEEAAEKIIGLIQSGPQP